MAYLGSTDLYVPFSAYEGVLTRVQMLEAIDTAVRGELVDAEQRVRHPELSLDEKIEVAKRIVRLIEARKAMERTIVGQRKTEDEIAGSSTSEAAV